MLVMTMPMKQVQLPVVTLEVQNEVLLVCPSLAAPRGNAGESLRPLLLYAHTDLHALHAQPAEATLVTDYSAMAAGDTLKG